MALTFGYPVIVAGGMRVAEGIARFKGEIHPMTWNIQHTQLLIRLCIWGTLLPALFFWGLRARARWRLNPGGRWPLTRITLALTVGGFAVVSLLSFTVFSSVAWGTYRQMREDNSLAARNDLLIHEVSLLATNARVHYFLPREKGGGGGHG